MIGIFNKIIKYKMITITILIIISIIMACAGVYFITLQDAIYSNGDNKNAPYKVDEYTDSVHIDDDGTIHGGKTAQQLWDEMKKSGNRAVTYLNNAEELQKLMNAELITQYLDTRQDPDQPIDWEADELNDVNSDKIQGIVKLKRADTSGNKYTMKYTDPNTFQSYIDAYNSSGSEVDRDTALRYFTLQKTVTTTGTGGQAPTIEKGTTINIPAGLGNIHTYMGWQIISSRTSAQWKLREMAGMNFDEEGFGRINGRYVIACTTTFGTTGDYIDFYQEDGTVIPAIIGDIKNQNDENCTEWGHNGGRCIVEFVVDKDTWYSGGSVSHANPGQEGFHMEWNQNLTHAVNGGSYFDDPTFESDNVSANGNTAGGKKDKEENVVKYTTKFYAKVATWNEQTTTITSTDPDVEPSEEHSYSMSSTNVNYQDMVKKFSMPFEYIWALVTTTENIDMCLEVSDLVYNSELDVTVHDNLQTETTTTTNTYTEKQKTDTFATVNVKYGKDATSTKSKDVSDTWNDEESHDYEIVSNVVTKTNTLDVALTKANIWFENYEQKFVHEQQPTVLSTNKYEEVLENINYPNEPNSTVSEDIYGHAAALLTQTENKYKNANDYVTGNIKKVESKIYNATVNRKQITNNQRERSNYVSSPPEVNEKTDPKSSEPNFVTIMLKPEYALTKRKLIGPILGTRGIQGWWLEILESNEKTSDMVDLTRYLIRKISNNKYYKDFEFNFQEYGNSSMSSVGGNGNNGNSETGSKIVEIARSKLGCAYQLGAKGPYTFDCSGFVYWVYKQVGIDVPGNTDAYKAYQGSDKEISWQEAKPGDILVIFGSERGTTYGHAGIYLGNDEYIHAPQTGDVVKVSQGAKEKFKHVFRFYTEVTSGTAAEGDGYDSTITFNNREYKEYKQTRGSYVNTPFGVSGCGAHGVPHVHSNGCGPTSVAIVASGYGKNYSPGDIATLMGGQGVQSSGATISSVLNKIGIPAHSIYAPSKQNLMDQLKSGRPFVVSVDSSLGGMFTNGGHLMAVLSINGNQVYVSNPNPAKVGGWVSLDDLYACCAGKYVIFVDQN